ncbi:carbohydrate kinase family protein [Paenibacillus spongiae]|uniref:Carbohydrate kinase family protein n=1 Tax=Paenibacillus spongiae TaxID=2909671 RepID=A0ABY5S7V7_9BACL|nr:carbohydrate kinase family protein [Paenibacillus spongiae]UVI28917.1 carbohydrate kinase family protein [Paenibacillus spongiae]
MKKFDAIVIGDVNIDLVVVGYDRPPLPGQEIFVDNIMTHLGGGAALFSLSLAKLGLKLAFNGILGDDYYGRFLMKQFEQYGIDTSYINLSQTANTGISIALHPEKDRSFITYAGSNAQLSLRQLDRSSVAEGRHVHLTCYKGSANHADYMETVMELKKLGVTLSFDTGWDDTGEWYRGILDLAAQIDVFFMNETEAMHYTRCATVEEAITHLARHGKHVVVKLGSKGAMAIVDGKRIYHPGFQVEARDTTGAGDSFNAGYIYGYLTGKEPAECLVYGNACGALSVSAYGGSTGTLDHEAMLRFIAGHTDASALQEEARG